MHFLNFQSLWSGALYILPKDRFLHNIHSRIWPSIRGVEHKCQKKRATKHLQNNEMTGHVIYKLKLQLSGEFKCACLSEAFEEKWQNTRKALWSSTFLPCLCRPVDTRSWDLSPQSPSMESLFWAWRVCRGLSNRLDCLLIQICHGDEGFIIYTCWDWPFLTCRAYAEILHNLISPSFSVALVPKHIFLKNKKHGTIIEMDTGVQPCSSATCNLSVRPAGSFNDDKL